MYEDLIKRLRARDMQNFRVILGFLTVAEIAAFLIVGRDFMRFIPIGILIAIYPLWMLFNGLSSERKIKSMEAAVQLQPEQISAVLEHSTPVNEYIYVSDQYVLNYVTYHAYRVADIQSVSLSQKTDNNGNPDGFVLHILCRTALKDRIGFGKNEQDKAAIIHAILSAHLQQQA